MTNTKLTVKLSYPRTLCTRAVIIYVIIRNIIYSSTPLWGTFLCLILFDRYYTYENNLNQSNVIQLKVEALKGENSLTVLLPAYCSQILGIRNKLETLLVTLETNQLIIRRYTEQEEDLP